MAFTPDDLALAVDTIGGGNLRIHFYQTTDDLTTVTGANYFPDGKKRGLREDDLMVVSAPAANYVVRMISETTATVDPDFLGPATQNDAEAGSSNLVGMTPLRTKQFAAAYLKSKAAPWDITELLVADSSGAAAANATVINDAIQFMGSTRKGGKILARGNIYVGATIDNNVNGVTLQGPYENYFHDGGTPVHGLTLIPTFAGTVLKHRTVYGASQSKNSGGGFQHFTVTGNEIATRLLDVDTVNNGVYDLTLLNCVGGTNFAAAVFDCGETSTDVAEAADIQNARARLFIRQLDSAAAKATAGIALRGSTTANVCFCNFDIVVQHYDHHGVILANADNNTMRVRTIQTGGGSSAARGLVGYGGTGDNQFCRSNEIYLSSNTVAAFTGTDTSGVTQPVVGMKVHLDTENGTPMPLFGTGCTGTVWNSSGRLLGNVNTGMLVADNVANHNNAFGFLGTTSLLVSSDSENHLKLINGGLTGNGLNWSLSVMTGGTLRFQLKNSSGTVLATHTLPATGTGTITSA